MTTWITADTHYYHANIIIYTNRLPWCKPDYFIEESGKRKWKNKEIGRVQARVMTDDMVNWHNELVKPGDRVLHLGDFSFGTSKEVIQLLRRLNGNYEFIWGNHDKSLKDFASIIHHYSDLMPRVKFLGDLHETEVDHQGLVLCHYAMRTWNKSHHGNWHIYGHSHGSLPDDPCSLSLDVGVDCHNYRPISIARLEELMSKKTFKPIDHHGKV